MINLSKGVTRGSGFGGAIILMALIIATSILVSIVYVTRFAINPSPLPTTQGPGGQQVVSLPPGIPVTLAVSGFDPVTGTLTNVNAELWGRDDSQKVPETQVNAALTILATDLPNNFNGYIMIGNDAEQSLTDRGTEYYYRKYPVSWTNEGGRVTFERIPTYKEGIPIWTGKDEGTVEATTNITVDTGETDTSLSLKIQVSPNSYLGNPDPALDAFSRNRLAICFNESSGGLLDTALTRPSVGTKPLGYIPGNFSAFRMLGCWILTDINWLDDDPNTPEGATYEFGVTIKANAGKDPGITDNMVVSLWDLTWVKDDRGIWRPGWSDESEITADGDAGLRAFGNEKVIYFT